MLTLDFHSWLDRHGGLLVNTMHQPTLAEATGSTHNLLDDLGRRCEVDQAFVDAQLVAIPSLGTC